MSQAPDEERQQAEHQAKTGQLHYTACVNHAREDRPDVDPSTWARMTLSSVMTPEGDDLCVGTQIPSGGLRAMADSDLERLAIEARRRASAFWSRPRQRWWWKQVRYGAEFEVALRTLAARPWGSPPTVQQAGFLELLRDGARNSHELAQVIDYDDPELYAAIRDAQVRGWVRGWLGGIGGVVAHPPAWYELTATGHDELRSAPCTPRPAPKLSGESGSPSDCSGE